MKATRQDALKLLMDASECLADIEHAGIRVDTEYLNRTLAETADKISRGQAKLRTHSLYEKWRRAYGERTNLGSREQLAKMVFGKEGLNLPSKGMLTATGRVKADVAALEHLDHPFVKKYLQIEKLKKAHGTYLTGIHREVCNGYLRPSFNINLAATYRLSSSNPNFQNMPIRDPFIGELIRRCFIARNGHQLVEIDYVAIEVRVAACYHRDPAMIEYIKDPSKDMHRDMAAQIYMVPPDGVEKMVRFAAKSYFVFAQFYGDYYLHCAKGLWSAIDRLSLQYKGKSLKEHLARKGISKLGACDPEQDARPGTFEYHVKKVEEDFWGRRFQKYANWKKTYHAKQQARGYFDTFTGFRIPGYHKRNDVINYGTQCDASQCTLKSCILLNKALKKRQMKSRIVGIIHDSIVGDVHTDEIQDYLSLADNIMTRRIPKLWPWIIVPLEIEVDVSPPGGSWFDKKPWVELGTNLYNWGPK